MSIFTSPIPNGYHSLTPYLAVQGAAQAIAFYEKALGAKELFRMDNEGRVTHAEIQIGDSRFMLADEHSGVEFRGPKTLGGTPVTLLIYVSDVDAFTQRATEAGMEVIRPVKDEFYGDRMGTFRDPFGHVWHIATHVEDVSPEEMKRRMDKKH